MLLTKAFCVFVRPILEFSSVVWNPLLKQDIVKVKSVQRRFTKRLKGFHNLPYTTRLSNLGLDSLHCRRTKADLSMCYKIINNHTCTQIASFLTFSSTSKTSKIRSTLFLTVSCCRILLQPLDINLISCIYPIIVIIKFFIVVHIVSSSVTCCTLHSCTPVFTALHICRAIFATANVSARPSFRHTREL